MNEKVFTPITLGNVTIKNRIVLPSMCVCFAEDDGTIGPSMIEYIRERAGGGIGLIIIGGSPHGNPGPDRPALSDDTFLPGWKQMAGVVHEYGAKLFCQLHPDAFQAGLGEYERPSEYSTEEIRALIKSYADCALRAQKAGVDGVEIHGAHAHEVAQFMSPYYNDRTDDYGGGYRGRAKFSQEIVRAIKDTCGKDYPLIFRISGDERVEGGRKIKETVKISQLIIEAGADAIHVSTGMPESQWYCTAPMDVPECFNLDNAAAVVKKAVDVPVIAVGRFVHLEQAEKAIQEGKVDMVAMARANLCDANLINKMQGKDDLPVRSCIGCNQGCRDVARYRRIRCMQNARLGRETSLNFEKVSPERQKIKIMIVGAGPAGLEAAVDLTERGFKPVVFEKDDKAGGLINLAMLSPCKASMGNITAYRLGYLQKKNIDIHLNQKVDLAAITEEKPDVLILATGSSALMPDIPGTCGNNVFSGDMVLMGTKVPGKRVALIGGGLIGCEVAEYLVTQEKEVVIFEMADDIAKDLNPDRRYFTLKRMSKAGIKVNLLTRVSAIRLPELDVFSKGYLQTFTGFDAVVTAVGRKSVNELAAQIADNIPEIKVFLIGDADTPGLALDAISQAAEVAANL